MTFDEVYEFFGSTSKACNLIGITRQSFSAWKARGYIPFKTQKKIEFLTKGKLVARIEDIPKYY